MVKAIVKLTRCTYNGRYAGNKYIKPDCCIAKCEIRSMSRNGRNAKCSNFQSLLLSAHEEVAGYTFVCFRTLNCLGMLDWKIRQGHVSRTLLSRWGEHLNIMRGNAG